MRILYSALICIEILFFMVSFKHMWKKDVFSSVLYIFLFYFSLTLVTAYLFFPVEMMQNRYVIAGLWDGNTIYWLECYFFTFLSLIMYYFFTVCILTKRAARFRIVIVKESRNSSFLKTGGFFFVIVFTAVDIFLFLKNYELFSYFNSINNRGNNSLYDLACTIIVSSSYFVCGIMTLAYDIAANMKLGKRILQCCSWICLIILLIYAYKSGDRSTLVIPVFGIGIPLIKKYESKLRLRHFIIGGMGAIGLYLFISFGATTTRNLTRLSAATLWELLFPSAFQQNVFSMFAVIKYRFIDTKEVVFSTISNFLIGSSYPYLFETVTNIYANFSVNATSSFGHFLFVDGYVFCGFAGVLYNGFVIALFTTIWSRIAKTNDSTLNNMILSTMCALSLSLVRGSGMGNFIKYLYMYLLPIVLLYCAISGRWLKVYYRRR